MDILRLFVRTFTKIMRTTDEDDTSKVVNNFTKCCYLYTKLKTWKIQNTGLVNITSMAHLKVLRKILAPQNRSSYSYSDE